LGPGLLESLYEKALYYEFKLEHLSYKNQLIIPIMYKGIKLGEHRIDTLVENEIIVELKAVSKIEPVFEAQLLSYLRLTGKKVGLLINFNVPVLRNGVKRMVL
jgi:GxxExxY protein